MMIVFLHGKLASKTPTSAVIECNGIGYEVHAPIGVIERLPATGDSVFVLTEMVVREESQTLYGFLEERERRIFRALLKVSGVGAKTALTLMSALSADDLLAALASGDTARLSTAPGIGKKTAERMVVDFRGSPLLDMPAIAALPQQNNRDVELALEGLGYKRVEISRALSALPADTDEDPAVRLRAVLQILSGK